MSSLPRLDAPFIDRESERRLLNRLLADAGLGRSGVLVVRGQAGIGKTALMRYASRHRSDFRTEQIAAAEAEMELPFAGLQQLLSRMLDRLDAIPPPQRTALEVAFGLAPGPPPDRFLLSLAALSLVAAVAEERPLLCLVDDAQWLDDASAQVLSFVGRRLFAEPVALVFGMRDPADVPHFDDLPTLRVEGLRRDDARALLTSVVPWRVDARVRDRLIAEARGNPLALLELPRDMTTAELGGGFRIPLHDDVPGRLEEIYERRSAGLPARTRRLLLLAAAEPVGDPALIWRAAELLGLSADALTPAESAGLVEIDTAVRFPHPLVRSAVYRSAAPEERRVVHAALADATDRELDRDRFAWHRAAAASGPDEDVASELERSADRARARGGLAACAAFLRRAVELTPDADRRIERALAAAQTSTQAGAFDAAATMLATAERAPLDALATARVTLVRGQAAFAAARSSDATRLLLQAAEQLVPLDLELARTAWRTGIGASFWCGAEHSEASLAACRAVLANPAPKAGDRAADVLLDGMATLVAEGHATAAPLLMRATKAFSGPDVSVEDSVRWGWLATAPPNALWDDEGLRAVCTRQIEVLRDAGALGGAHLLLAALGTLAARSGDFEESAATTAELNAMSEATGARVAPFNAILILALRGREEEAEELIAATLGHVSELQQVIAGTVARWAASLLYNGLGRFGDAREAAAAAAATPNDPFAAVWALPELVEAAVRTGAMDVARSAVERLAGTTRPAGTDFGLGVEARSRALVTEGDEAEGHYRRAIDHLGRTRVRADLARAHLVYGEWLGAEGRNAAARPQLRSAYDLFTDMGLGAFAERTRRQLVAAGETVFRRAADADAGLTAQEQQIAHLARDGLSNAEIGARLFLSPRTVEWHLRKVFSKLGIQSRRELAGAPLRDRGDERP